MKLSTALVVLTSAVADAHCKWDTYPILGFYSHVPGGYLLVDAGYPSRWGFEGYKDMWGFQNHRSPHGSVVERITSNDEVVSSILAVGKIRLSFSFFVLSSFLSWQDFSVLLVLFYFSHLFFLNRGFCGTAIMMITSWSAFFFTFNMKPSGNVCTGMVQQPEILKMLNHLIIFLFPHKLFGKHNQ